MLMKAILQFTGYEVDLRPFITDRHPALLPLANSTLLDHTLAELTEAGVKELVLVGSNLGLVVAWLAAEWPGLRVVVASSMAAGAGETAVFFLTAHTAFDIRWASFAASKADFIHWPSERTGTAGVYWFRSGKQAARVVGETAVWQNLPQLAAVAGLRVEQLTPDFCAPVDSIATWLHANERLLGLGFASEDAIERGYGEEFTVLPPVFVAETAVVEKAVIGPFVAIGSDAVVRESVLTNCIVDANAQVENAVLDRSIVGRGGVINGRKRTVLLNDGEEIGD
ncbi:MAG: hypothetical protein KC423_01805 [Anaerolineales bacterium]|nr:hypothetical protein [Anaerolineales bacterium]